MPLLPFPGRHLWRLIRKLLERLDVVNSKIAEEAMKAFFESRPEVLNSFSFNGTYTPLELC